MLSEPDNELVFRAASMWEIAIRRGLGRDDFQRDLHSRRRGPRDTGYVELPVTADHALGVTWLPRLLVAQTIAEGIMLLTVGKELGRYSCPIRMVRPRYQDT